MGCLGLLEVQKAESPLAVFCLKLQTHYVKSSDVERELLGFLQGQPRQSQASNTQTLSQG
jgi:hypothetical protein